MYNINLRRLLMNSTVRDLRKALECLPDDMEIFCCGTNKLWLHVDDERNLCNFDYENLSDCEDYADEEDFDDSEAWEDDSDRGCSDCPPSECTGHCMSCAYRPI